MSLLNISKVNPTIAPETKPTMKGRRRPNGDVQRSLADPNMGPIKTPITGLKHHIKL